MAVAGVCQSRPATAARATEPLEHLEQPPPPQPPHIMRWALALCVGVALVVVSVAFTVRGEGVSTASHTQDGSGEPTDALTPHATTSNQEGSGEPTDALTPHATTRNQEGSGEPTDNLTPHTTTATNSREQRHSNATRNKKSRKAAKGKQVNKQVKKLQKLGCRPHWQKVQVWPLLSPTANVSDFPFFPKVVAVRRCQPDCSYCGNDSGVETGKCVVAKAVKRRYQVSYFPSWPSNTTPKYHSLHIQVHQRCKCEALEADR